MTDLADKLPAEFGTDSLADEMKAAAAQRKQGKDDPADRLALDMVAAKWEELAAQGLPAVEIIRRINRALGLPENFHPDAPKNQ